jgi:hypothetical protein
MLYENVLPAGPTTAATDREIFRSACSGRKIPHLANPFFPHGISDGIIGRVCISGNKGAASVLGSILASHRSLLFPEPVSRARIESDVRNNVIQPMANFVNVLLSALLYGRIDETHQYL